MNIKYVMIIVIIETIAIKIAKIHDIFRVRVFIPTIVTVIAPGPESDGMARGTSAKSAFCSFPGSLSPNCDPLRTLSSPTKASKIPPAILSE